LISNFTYLNALNHGEVLTLQRPHTPTYWRALFWP